MEPSQPIPQASSTLPQDQIIETQSIADVPSSRNKRNLLVVLALVALIAAFAVVGGLVFRTQIKPSTTPQSAPAPITPTNNPSGINFTSEQGQPLGEQKTLVVLFNYQNNANDQTYSREMVNDIIFGETNSLNQYYKEVSYGKTWLTGKVVGYYTVPYNTGPEFGGCMQGSHDALDLVRKAGVNVDDYPRQIFITPPLEGCNNASGSTGENPSDSLISGKLSLSALAHEFGHNLTIAHADLYDCGDKPIAGEGECSIVMYGDSMSAMGHVNPINGHHNALHKLSLGWIPKEDVIEATQNGTYRITPLETQSNQPQVIKIHKPDTNEDYYLEYRQPIGLDASLPKEDMTGALIRIGYYFPYVINGNTYQTPETKLINMHSKNFKDSSHASLADGESFFDEINKIRVTQLSHDSGEVQLSIKFE